MDYLICHKTSCQNTNFYLKINFVIIARLSIICGLYSKHHHLVALILDNQIGKTPF